MKTATVLLLGIAAIGVTVVAVTLLKPKVAPQNPAPGASPGGANSWLGVASGILTLGSQAFKTFGSSGSPKPTTPSQVNGSTYSDASSFYGSASDPQFLS